MFNVKYYTHIAALMSRVTVLYDRKSPAVGVSQSCDNRSMQTFTSLVALS